MALPSSGQLGIVEITVYRSPSAVGWGGTGISGSNNMNYYAGRTYYIDGSGGKVFPTSNLKITDFYGTSPVDEWNCACACECPCGK